MTTRSGARTRSPSGGAEDVERALEESFRAAESGDGQADEGDAFDGVHLRIRPQHLEHARNDVDLDVAVLHRADHCQRLLVRVRRERDRDTVHGVLVHEFGQVGRRSEEFERLVPVRGRRGVAVDEADDPQPVLGMVSDLAGEQPGHLAGPDDDDVLHVRRAPTSQHARDRP